jgi:hypothetical protein
MSFSLRPHQLIAHWVPGFVVLATIAAVISLGVYGMPMQEAWKLLDATAILAMAVGAFIVGQVIDAFRNVCLETRWDKRRDGNGKEQAINWDFFFSCTDQRLANLGTYYFDYYVFDVNIVIGIALSLVSAVVITVVTNLARALPFLRSMAYQPAEQWSTEVLVVVGVALVVYILSRDAMELRREMVRLTCESHSESVAFPHDGVYVRLQPSPIHGVGVFAIRDIPIGTELLPNDKSELTWRTPEELNLSKLDANVRQLYLDFCIIKDGGRRFGCPKNFNLLTPVWYLNHSKKPNVRCDEEYRFFTLREIKTGEELTADYETYNDFGAPPDYINYGSA